MKRLFSTKNAVLRGALLMAIVVLFFENNNLYSQRIYGTLAGNSEDKVGLLYSLDIIEEQTPVVEFAFEELGQEGFRSEQKLTYYKGRFWGVARRGGENNEGNGIVFFLTPTQEPGNSDFKVAAEFSKELESTSPVSPLTYHNGYFYGIAGGGDVPASIYRINPENPEEFETVASFEGITQDSFGDNLGAPLISYNGALYGILRNEGVLFKYEKGNITQLFNFSNQDRFPNSIALRNGVISVYFTGNTVGTLQYNPATNNSTVNQLDEEVISNQVAGFTLFRNDFLTAAEPTQTQSDDIAIGKLDGGFISQASQFVRVPGNPKSLLTSVLGKFLVGTGSNFEGGGVFAYNIDQEEFLLNETFAEMQQGAPEYSTPEVRLPFTEFKNGKWTNGEPDERTIAYVEDSLYVTTTLKCHDLYVSPAGKIILAAGQTQVTRDIHNSGVIEILTCNDNNLPSISQVGSFYGFETRDVNVSLTPGVESSVQGFLNEPFSLQLQATYLADPTWGVATVNLPAEISLSVDNNGIMSGDLGAVGGYSIDWDVDDQVTGCSFDGFFQLQVSHRTTWNGNNWSNGAPSDGSSIVIIDGLYTVSSSEDEFACNQLTVNEGKTLRINDRYTINTNTYFNYGTIRRACTASLNGSIPETDPNINQVEVFQPIITPLTTNATIKVGESNSITFAVSNIGIDWNWSNNQQSFIPGMTFQNVQNGGENEYLFTGVPTTVGTYNLNLFINSEPVGSTGGCSANKTYTVNVIDGISPNLRTQDMRATFGDKNVRAIAITDNDEVPYFFSMEEDACASINQNTGKITVNCAGQFEFYVTQAADDFFKSDSVAATLFIDKATPTLVTGNSAFILQDETDSIPYFTNSDTIPTFQQFSNGGTDVATVSPDGYVELLTAGSFTVFITLPETDNYNTKTIKRTFSVVNEAIPPIGTPDTMIVVVGANDTINVLDNDLGGTGTIQPQLTDIDLENPGVQSKFFSPSMGTFTIDADGNLSYSAFEGFIGSGEIYYTIRDEFNSKSDPIAVYIEVVIPTDAPELIATELITPNDDDLNDAFVIGNVNLDKTNYLRIFDRYGNEIYYKEDYQNDWEGVLDNGDIVDDGTYFFIFKEDDRSILRGTFQIKRQK